MNRDLTGTGDLLRNLDVGEMMRLRNQVAELEEYKTLFPFLLECAKATVLRLPGWDEKIQKAESLIK